MTNRICKLFKKYSNVISYLFFGGLTTLVNFLVYFPFYNWLRCSAVFSNMVARVVAVIFAFVTNKPFVFKSHDWSRNVVIPELSKFVSCRIGSGLLETFFVWLLVDVLSWNGNLVKIGISVLVVILNYVASKWFVFFNKKE